MLLVCSIMGYGLPSVTNDITSNQYFDVFYNLFYSIISQQTTDHPFITWQNKQSFLPGSPNHDVATFLVTRMVNLLPGIKSVCLSLRSLPGMEAIFGGSMISPLSIYSIPIKSLSLFYLRYLCFHSTPQIWY